MWSCNIALIIVQMGKCDVAFNNSSNVNMQHKACNWYKIWTCNIACI